MSNRYFYNVDVVVNRKTKYNFTGITSKSFTSPDWALRDVKEVVWENFNEHYNFAHADIKLVVNAFNLV